MIMQGPLGRYSHVLRGRKRRVAMGLEVVTFAKISVLCQDLEEFKTRIAGLAFTVFIAFSDFYIVGSFVMVSYLYFSVRE